MKEPKIRIKGFQGEWEEKNIGSFCSISIGEFVIKTKQRANAPYPVYNGGSTNTGYYDQYNQIGPKVIVSARGANAGFVNKEEGKYWAGNSCYSIGTNDETNWLFLYYAFKFYQDMYIKAQQAANIPSVSKSDIQKTILLFPSISEQQSIASYFQHLDSLIQSTTKEIESLKQVKAASLQSMFPQEGETTPRVRFKGFEGEWSICPLKYFAKKSTEKNISMDYTITLTNSAEYGVINQRDFFDHDISNDDHINGYYVIHHDDFVYNPRVSTAAPVGPISRNRLGYSGVMSPLYLIFRVNGINKDFLSYYFKTTLWHNYMKLEGNTGARFDRLAISDEQFFNMPIYYPKDEEEQTAIASYFTNLDRQITLHTQRLEKLKQIKSACLDNMFV